MGSLPGEPVRPHAMPPVKQPSLACDCCLQFSASYGRSYGAVFAGVGSFDIGVEATKRIANDPEGKA